MVALISLDEARRRVLDQVAPGHPTAVPLADSLGCVTSIALICDSDVPPFAGSAMDGFAVRSADVTSSGAVLEVAGEVRAGQAALIDVGPGQAVRLMTGAPIPPGADAVVMVEQTEPVRASGVRIGAVATAGQHVRPPGSDMAAGSEIFPAFTELGPAHLGVLASAGLRRVPVFPRVRVGVLSTGDELADGPMLGPGQIRDANRPALLALCQQSGFAAVDLGVVPDDEAATRDAVINAVQSCDALITSGGVSMGDFDHVKVVLDQLSPGSMTWMQVAIKPAKPLSFGVVSGKPVFGLPGNPVSSLVSFELFARPALRKMMGHRRLDRTRVLAAAPDGIERTPDGKTHFVRVTLQHHDGRFEVRPVTGQASHQLRALALADGLAIVPDGTGIAPGARVECIALTYP